MAGTEPTTDTKADRFLALHRPGSPLLMPNAWDAGSAKLFESLGFEAVATTSSGFAATLGRLDGSVSLDEAIAHSAVMVAATDVPVSADLENCYAEDLAGVARTVTRALEAGLAGCSIEDYTRESDEIYEFAVAQDRVAAAAEVAHRGPARLVLTARAENFLHGRPDLLDTIARLQAFQEMGADVLYAPGIRTAEEIRAIVTSVDRPVNVLARSGAPTVAELGALGVGRISVGGAFAWVALSAAVEAANELRAKGTYDYFDRAMDGAKAARAAFNRT
ncbi:MAG TPA: isocitrate lyase/phosphoenolpyruvate mutase family protein [Acidimicrobiales bacterium]|jgi:2-methylisocitrate lyase-like PEP mutase family enzyme|nr:isocitrate lyase/phosphoenolpyruvate mutase family protein [Acidimicrobiales bacterium]